MTVSPWQGSGSNLAQRGSSSSLYDVLELILDKGLVIDAYIRVSLVGIELLTIDIRIVIASVDTYLRFAEAVNRVDLTQTGKSRTLPEFIGDMEEKGAGRKVKGALGGAAESVGEVFHRGGDDEEDEEDKEERGGKQKERVTSSRARQARSRLRSE
ncbi:gas vesicle protein GvpJ [Actinopolymorpha sp. NPDC004070]|uniref:gas vesicle protein GvpJ n=1 Tax=Actinopolymorpha sp. NPDC004070 TaxID=3154548 RepID=UPI0033B94A1F